VYEAARGIADSEANMKISVDLPDTAALVHFDQAYLKEALPYIRAEMERFRGNKPAVSVGAAEARA
jgi:hypothetical protein